MKKVVDEKKSSGRLEVLEDMKKHLFLAKSHGAINPSLVKKDLNQARLFAEKCPDHWTYVTNTEDVKLVNPLNMFFLKEVKKIKKLKEIVVFAPSAFNRFLLYLASPIFQADRIIKNKTEFLDYLAKVS